MKKVANVFTAPAKHWVGNGFHVASMFSYNDKDKNLDPFLLMDYNEPKFFQGGRRDHLQGRRAHTRRDEAPPAGRAAAGPRSLFVLTRRLRVIGR